MSPRTRPPKVADRQTFDALLAGLDLRTREALLLRHGRGFGYIEMAAVTGDSVSALKMRVKRGSGRVAAATTSRGRAVTDDKERDIVARRIADWYMTPAFTDRAHEQRVIAAATMRRTAGRRYVPWIVGAFAAAAVIVGAAIVNARWHAGETQLGTVAVRFVLRGAATARHVTVVGDFNDWSATATPLDRSPSSATWIADVRVAPGRYGYAFVVDGQEWITDPTAPLAPDAFGHPTSVLVVGAGGAA